MKMLLNLFVCLLLGVSLKTCHCDNIVYGTESSGKSHDWDERFSNGARKFWNERKKNYPNWHQIQLAISGDKLLFEKVLFAKNLPLAKNYTLIFKYIGSEISPNISHAKFEVFNTVSVKLFNKRVVVLRNYLILSNGF